MGKLGSGYTLGCVSGKYVSGYMTRKFKGAKYSWVGCLPWVSFKVWLGACFALIGLCTIKGIRFLVCIKLKMENWNIQWVLGLHRDIWGYPKPLSIFV